MSTNNDTTSSTAVKKTNPRKTGVKKTASKKEVVEEEVLVEEEVVVEEEVSVDKPTKVSRVVNKESVLASFDELVALIDAEIEALRGESKKGATGVKFLRCCNAKIKQLKTQTAKISKGKNKKSATTTNSGFLKPVQVSTEVLKFAGWKNDELHSRVDVTKFICNHIKENNLQKPDDRRRIIPDSKLRKLLKFEGEDFRYCDIQSMMKPHFNASK